jgi:hypothetical protein
VSPTYSRNRVRDRFHDGSRPDHLGTKWITEYISDGAKLGEPVVLEEYGVSPSTEPFGQQRPIRSRPPARVGLSQLC